MKPLLLCVSLSLPIISCRTTCVRDEPTADERRLIDLLRQGDYSKAAVDSDHFGGALFYYIRELRESQGSAEVVLRTCDLYLSRYPFTISDLDVNIERLEEVALARVGAAVLARIPDEWCLRIENIHGLGQADAVLENFPNYHHDGGRCAHRFYHILRETVHGGPGWSKTSTFSGAGTLVFEDEAYLLRHYFEKMARLFDDALVLLAGLRVGEFRKNGGYPAVDAFWLEELTYGRWARLFGSYLGWLNALELPPNVDGLKRTGKILMEDQESSTLRRLGEAIVAFNERYEECRLKKGSPPDMENAAEVVIERAGSTPFSDQIRFAVIRAYIEREEVIHAESVFRKYLKDRALGPHPASYALYWMGRVSAETAPNRARAFFEEAVRNFPAGAATPWAYLELANGYEKPEDRIRGLKSLMEAPRLERSNPLSKTIEDARSEAGRHLALYYQERKEWEKSLAIWETWSPRSWCATCEEGLDLETEFNLGRCFEELGQAEKAKLHYWNAAPTELKAAQRLRDLHERSGTLPLLRRMTADRIEKIKAKEREDLNRYEGLEWLREMLLRP